MLLEIFDIVFDGIWLDMCFFPHASAAEDIYISLFASKQHFCFLLEEPAREAFLFLWKMNYAWNNFQCPPFPLSPPLFSTVGLLFTIFLPPPSSLHAGWYADP